MQISFTASVLSILLVAIVMIAQAAPTPAPVSGIQARNIMSGEATYYAVGMGSCGEISSDDELVAALSSNVMGGFNSELCGSYIDVESPSGSVTVKIVDTCPACSDGDLDLSETAFQELGGQSSSGRIPITWSL